MMAVGVPWDLPRWTTLSLRAASNDLSPADISNALGLTPSRVIAKDDLLSPSNPRSARAKQNLWLLKSDVDPAESLTTHLSSMLDALEARRDAVGHLAQSCDIDLFAGFSSESQAGDTIPHDIIRRLATFPLALVLDLYPPSRGPGDAVTESQGSG